MLLEYDRRISELLKVYRLEREYQIYALNISFRTKEDREQVENLDKLRLKFFRDFFKNLRPIVGNP